MTTEKKLIQTKLGLLKLAEKLGCVSVATASILSKSFMKKAEKVTL